MRKAILVAVAGLVLVPTSMVAKQAPSPSAETVAEQFRITNGAAGWLSLGMPIEDVYRRFGDAKVRLVAEFPEGMFQPVLEVRLDDAAIRPALKVDIREAPCDVFPSGRSGSATSGSARRTA